jgi:multidrug resistance efflux pump
MHNRNNAVLHACRFVEQEVERVKVLFDQKEARLRSERDTARQQLAELRGDRDSLEDQVRVS